MGKYTFNITRHHTYTCQDDITITVDAEDEKQARERAREAAYEEARPSSRDARHDDTDIESIDLERHDPDDGEAHITIRCDATADLFARAA